ncbi:NAD(P)H nitroreductase [Virgisporangium aliadipatigenens]|uniref:NAD(P)H nitroreductase n=1 Tax=Virgisporangium aliadipatigenens TaxID=741659 RepID=A0A8J4DRW8_9ACTN|nr:nitroreductase [Virgisporangium aliadipatigenens]GIJ48114.1 NAD(P)H nitroreductase [Virgisporangium aliadipatigenens]
METNPLTEALATAAETAGRAPSIHNTQPWRWVVRNGALELHTVPERRLHELDPEGHLMLLSCGAALFHARVSLAAQGLSPTVERRTAEPLAVIRTAPAAEPDAHARRLVEAGLRRHTDRRPTSTTPVDPDALAAVTAAVRAEGEQAHVLRAEQVLELAATVDRAARAEATDERQQAELGRWVGGERPDGTGIPDAAIPAAPPQTTVPGRDFGVTGTLPVDAGHDTQAVYAVLYGDGDAPVDWLRAGEALSAAWLEAVDRGLNLLPLSAPVEIAHTRQLLRRMLADVGHPHAVIRLGTADTATPGPLTPRLAADQLIDIVTD